MRCKIPAGTHLELEGVRRGIDGKQDHHRDEDGAISMGAGARHVARHPPADTSVADGDAALLHMHTRGSVFGLVYVLRRDERLTFICDMLRNLNQERVNA